MFSSIWTRRRLLTSAGSAIIIMFSRKIGRSADVVITATDLFASRHSLSNTYVGTFAIKGRDKIHWKFETEEGTYFRFSGNDLVVGPGNLRELDYPHTISVNATDGVRQISQNFKVRVPKPLPPLPFAIGAKVMGIGHSFMQRSGYSFATGKKPPFDRVDFNTAGWCGDISAIRTLDQRFNLDVWFDSTSPFAVANSKSTEWAGSYCAVGGWRMDQVLKNLDWCIDRQPSIIVLDIATNDINARIGLSLLKERYGQILDRVLEAGIYCVLLMAVKRDDWPTDDARAVIQDQFNDWLATLPDRAGVFVVDDRTPIAEAVADGSKVMEDGVHMTALGHWIRTKKLVEILRHLVSEGDFRPSDFRKNNLSGFSKGFLGRNGIKDGVTGAVADRLSIKRNVGCLDSIEGEVQGDFQVLRITPMTNDAVSRLSGLIISFPDILFADAGIETGDWIDASFNLWLSPSRDWMGVNFSLEAVGGSYYVNSGGMNIRLPETNPGPELTDGLTGKIVIPPFQVFDSSIVATPATAFKTSLRPLRFWWIKSSKDALEIKISPILVRKTADPRPTWRL